MKQIYERNGILDMNMVLEKIRDNMHIKKDPYRIDFFGDAGIISLDVASSRLRTFAAQEPVCCNCGIKAKYFAIERPVTRNDGSNQYHLNLYGIDSAGNEVMFCRVLKKSRKDGGDESSENSNIMCEKCHKG